MKMNKLLHYAKKLFVNSFRQVYWRHFAMSANLPLVNHVSPKCVLVGKGVCIGYNCRIEGVTQYLDKHFSPSIFLCEGVTIQQNAHITCAASISIGKNTAVAANVTITDINHLYEDVSLPIEYQNIEVNPVRIGDECKIYNNAVILPGVSIGNHCVVGANSVVTHDVPDYCVVAGAPAKIVKRYDPQSKKWVKTI